MFKSIRARSPTVPLKEARVSFLAMASALSGAAATGAILAGFLDAN